VTFRRPVNIGDLMKFRSWVMHTWPSPHNHRQVGGRTKGGLQRESGRGADAGPVQLRASPCIWGWSLSAAVSGGTA
jgi:hypothetical protein